ncbi:hypothetical protein AJ88_28755 [Mesorhizobium amorphae CCBAU 01583]|nr:hypothetical protein AJ88_28755 [Mesorhizobium amorphae CCBAU 01583]
MSFVAGPRPARRSADRMRSRARPVEIADRGEDLAVTIRHLDPAKNDLEMLSLHARSGRGDICAIAAHDHVLGGIGCRRSLGNFGYGFRLALLSDFENAIADRGMIEAVGIRQKLP